MDILAYFKRSRQIFFNIEIYIATQVETAYIISLLIDLNHDISNIKLLK